MKQPKIAFVHDYLINYGGAEKVLEALLELYPIGPVYTSMYDPAKISDTITGRKIICPQTALFKKFPKYLTFLMPMVFEDFDLREYDIVVSDSSAWSKGVLTKPEQLHISYIHTPPRFLYKYSVESAKRSAWYFKPFVTLLDSLLRVWDQGAAQRPNYLIANSEEVRSRIKKFYGRDAQVIYPPVDVVVEASSALKNKKPYFLVLGRLAAYKNFDLVVETFRNISTELWIIGTGREEKRLKEMAGPNVKFLGKVSDTEKHSVIENCFGVINAVEDEDFGIVPVEAMAHGKPVLAHKSGGHLETVIEGVNGMFFEGGDVRELELKIKEYEQYIVDNKYYPKIIKVSEIKFSKQRFQNEMKAFIEEKWAEHQKNNA